MLIIEEVFKNIDENIRKKVLEDIVVYMILNEESLQASSKFNFEHFSEKTIKKFI